MERQKLTEGYYVSPVITGGWQLARDHNDAQTETPIEALRTFTKSGFTTFDCADHYAGVEELIGAFRASYRDEQGTYPPIQVHTKYVPDRDTLDSIDREAVEAIIDRSRRRLWVGSLDLVQFHWWDYDVDRYVETAQVLADLQREGTIRHLGTTNFDVPHLRDVVRAGVPIVSQQVQYSLLDRRPERSMVEFCADNDISLLCYGTLAGGFLTDRYLGAPEPEPPMENRSLTKYRLIIDEIGGWGAFQSLLETLESVAERHDVSIANVATRYILDQPQVCSVIVGARDTSHLEDNQRVLDLELTEADVERIEATRAELEEVPGSVYGIEREEARHAEIMKYNSQ